jgi:hypothetical protein
MVVKASATSNSKQQHSRVVSGKKERRKRLAGPGDMGYMAGLQLGY